jgi:lysophospholipase L1-like esterase
MDTKKILLVALCFALAPVVEGEKKQVVKEINPIAIVSQEPGFCTIFHSWGFIGDSLCSGEHECHLKDGQKGYYDLYDYSWGQRLCAATGTKGENYSQGGETTKGWIEHFWNNSNNRNNNIDAKANPKQAYIIALGVNDKTCNFPVGNIDKDVDTDNFLKNADTYAGCYAGIIQRIKSIQPDAKIFVVTDPGRTNNNENNPYNEVVRAVAKKFTNVYVLDIAKYGPDYGQDSDFHHKYFLGGHLNAMGYQFTAWMFMTYINWIINNNIKDFEQAAFIGTSHKY